MTIKYAALHRERRHVQDEIAGWWDALDYAKAKALAAEDSAAWWAAARDYHAKAAAAQATLRAFDTAHPEILAELAAEADAVLTRFLEND